MVFGGGNGGDRRDDRESPDGLVPDLIRRAVQSSVQAFISSEEGKKSLVSALMPRELLHSVLQTVDTTKRDAVAMIGREMQTFLANLNVGEELTKILTSVSFEIRTEVRFVPNEDGTLRSEVRSTTEARPVKAEAKGRGRKAAASKKKEGATAGAGRSVRKAAGGTVDTMRRVVDKLADATIELAAVAEERRVGAGAAARSGPGGRPPSGDGTVS